MAQKIIFFSALCLMRWTVHPLKMTVCDVKYQSDKAQLTLKFKFFWDDLESVFEKQTGRLLDLTQPSAENDQLLAVFITQNFDLMINGIASV